MENESSIPKVIYFHFLVHYILLLIQTNQNLQGIEHFFLIYWTIQFLRPFDVYAILFRQNHFKRFQHHNYNQILLAFLSDIHYWVHPVVNTLKNHLNIFDEYPVENFQSTSKAYECKNFVQLNHSGGMHYSWIISVMKTHLLLHFHQNEIIRILKKI